MATTPDGTALAHAQIFTHPRITSHPASLTAQSQYAALRQSAPLIQALTSFVLTYYSVVVAIFTSSVVKLFPHHLYPTSHILLKVGLRYTTSHPRDPWLHFRNFGFYVFF